MGPLLALLFLLLSANLCLAGQKAPNGATTPTTPKLHDVNPQLLQLAIQDQWDRGNDMFSGKQLVPPPNINLNDRDAGRRAQVHKLLSDNAIISGRDFYYAALIFHHSESSEDLLFAHLLSVTAMTKGNASAKWLAAASFDRYLWSIKRSQVFGTQFQKGPDGKLTMEPYDRKAVSDTVRSSWCVVSLEQEDLMLKSDLLASTTTPTCK